MTNNNLAKEQHTRITINSLKNLDGVTDAKLNDMHWIPDAMHGVVDNWLRDKRKHFDIVSNAMEFYDKASDDFTLGQKTLENIAKSSVNLRSQINKYKEGILDFKQNLQQLNKGTQDADIFMGHAVFGGQWNDLNVDEDGNIQFGIQQLGEKTGSGKMSIIKLNDMPKANLITEPWATKKFIWDTYGKAKMDKDMGLEFDENFYHTAIMNNLNEFGPKNIIATAFTDIVGDGRSKSFAEMWEEGLKDKELYKHPLNGNPLPMDSVWMKDQENTEVLSMLLTKFTLGLLKDLYGTVDTKTGEIKQQNTVQKLIEKYSK